MLLQNYFQNFNVINYISSRIHGVKAWRTITFKHIFLSQLYANISTSSKVHVKFIVLLQFSHTSSIIYMTTPTSCIVDIYILRSALLFPHLFLFFLALCSHLSIVFTLVLL
jgi:hypothetical protein